MIIIREKERDFVFCYSRSLSNGNAGSVASEFIINDEFIGGEGVFLIETFVSIVFLLLQVNGLLELCSFEASLQEFSLLGKLSFNLLSHLSIDLLGHLLLLRQSFLYLSLHLMIDSLNVILEVLLLLLKEFVFPGPVALETQAFLLKLHLVLLEDLNWVSNELDISHAGSIVTSQAKVLNSGKASWLGPIVY